MHGTARFIPWCSYSDIRAHLAGDASRLLGSKVRTFERLDSRIDSNLQIQLATERVHHDASPLSDFHQLFEQLPVGTFRGNAKLDLGESRGRTGRYGSYLSLNLGDFRLPRLYGCKQVAHETASYRG